MKRTFSEKAILVIALLILGTFSMIAPIASAGSPASPTLASSTFFGGSGDQLGTGIATDGGAIYVTGDSPLYSWPSSTALVLKYAPDLSSPVWSRTFDYGTYFYSVAATKDGVFAAGANYLLTHDHNGDKEAKTFLAKFSSDGTGGPGPGGSLWATGGPGDLGAFLQYDGGEPFYAVTTAAEGSSTVIYAVGYFDIGWRGVYGIAKYDASGNFIRGITEPWDGNAGANGVTVLNGNIYSAGFGGGMPILWKHDKDLNQIWRKKDTGLAGWFNGVTASGNAIYAVGNTYTSGVTGSEDYLIQKYDEAGNLLWSKTSGGSDTDILTGVVGIGSRLFAVGYTKSVGSGGMDAVVLEIDPETGNTLSTTLFGGAQDDKANGIATDGTDIYVIGESRSFASPAGNIIGQNDVMLLRYTLDSTPPSVTISFPSPDGNNGWFRLSPVSGTVQADDPSNVVSISCTGATLSGQSGIGTPSATANLAVSGEGINDVICTATDGSGNDGAESGSVNTATINLDSIPPEVTLTPDRSPDINGWYNHAVTWTVTATDATSDSVTVDAPVTYSGPDTAAASVTGYATDAAGNTVSASATFQYDATDPEITSLSVSPTEIWPANHKMVDGTVSGTASDSTSGVKSVGGEILDEYLTLNPQVFSRDFTPVPGETRSFSQTVKLEAWRNGDDKDGRVYTIHVTVTDEAGNSVTADRIVIVPHDKRK
jgi:hypothetical protein